MKIYQLSAGGSEEYMLFLPVNESDFNRGVFPDDGKPRAHNWHPPQVKLRSDPYNEGKKVPDISRVAAGSIILSKRAVDLLRNHLEPYGELLPVDCEGETWFLYNITNVIAAIDLDKCERRSSGRIRKYAFKSNIVGNNEIFKVPETMPAYMYFNDVPGENLKTLVEKHDLKGLWFESVWED